MEFNTHSLFGSVLLFALLNICCGDVPADLVDQLPGFDRVGFKVYSGYLHVPGPVVGYDNLTIHYQFQEAQENPQSKPVVTWHQGGPGGSSMYGQYGEMGYFQVDSDGTHVNPYAWNKVANMLYLESPAGSSDPIGFSYCTRGGRVADICTFNDTSQAEAYAHTLRAFFVAFPEYSKHDLYLTGESYAGQYLPNIAWFIVNNDGFGLNLKGIAVGNGCWGGDTTHVICNGLNAAQNDVDMFFGKGLVSKPTYNAVYNACDFPNLSAKCDAQIAIVFAEVGPHNVYNIYDNCPDFAEWLKRSGKTMYWLHKYLRKQMNQGVINSETHNNLKAMGGGYDWSCGAMDAMPVYFKRSDVQKALHLGKPERSRMVYISSGPASITLYPELVKNMRILIFNGDADTCVPYKGNEEWIERLANAGQLTVNTTWHPWYIKGAEAHVPSGYATTYNAIGSKVGLDSFVFLTIRLAGHMVPTFQPEAALSFISQFFSGQPF